MTMSELTVPIDLIPDAVITVDRAGVIQQVNRQLATMFSYQANELVGQPIEILLPERVRERHINYRKAFQARPTMRPMGATSNSLAAARMAASFRSTSCSIRSRLTGVFSR
jgi:PAS domain-containing protein